VGSVTANTGYIGGSSGWQIKSNVITSSGGIEFSHSTTPSIKIGSTGYNSTGIWMGKDGSAWKLSISDGTDKFLWDGTNLGITTSKFKLSNGIITAQDAILSGSIRANNGYIGGLNGWTINTNVIAHSSGIEFSASTTPAIKLGATSYAGNGIWLGKGNNYSASFWNTSNARGLKWDG